MTNPLHQTRRALLIGNAVYHDPRLTPLKSPINDVTRLEEVLSNKEIGNFQVSKPILDEQSGTVVKSIARFFKSGKNGELLLLYFSGHGVRDPDTSRLFLATQETEQDLPLGSGVSISQLKEAIELSGASNHVIILDCCFSGLAAECFKDGQALGKGTTILTSCDEEKLAYEPTIGEDGCSLFTGHLINGLLTDQGDLDGDGYISVGEIFDYVSEKLKREKMPQRPGRYCPKLQIGEVILAQSVHGVCKSPICRYQIRIGVSPHEFMRHSIQIGLRGCSQDQSLKVTSISDVSDGSGAVVNVEGVFLGFKELKRLFSSGELKRRMGQDIYAVVATEDDENRADGDKNFDVDILSYDDEKRIVYTCRLAYITGFERERDEALAHLPSPTSDLAQATVYVTKGRIGDTTYYYCHSSYISPGFFHATKFVTNQTNNLLEMFHTIANLKYDDSAYGLRFPYVHKCHLEGVRYVVHKSLSEDGVFKIDLDGAKNVKIV